jgi:uncharacterized 2Fe-2S/4Fe-4S cluster protein (DUF4445 family)
MTLSVTFQPLGRRIDNGPGKTILEASQTLAVRGENTVEAPCGGKGLCGRCRVRVIKGTLEPPGESEKRLLEPDDLTRGYRLACQAVPLSSVEIEIPPESLTGRADLQVQGKAEKAIPDPAVRRYLIDIQSARLDRSRSVWQQVEQSLVNDHGLADPRIDSELVRVNDPLPDTGQVAVSLTGDEVTNIHTRPPFASLVGLAVDLGTTKVAGYLVNLETADVVAADGIMNPQIRYGDDVISRLAQALNGPDEAERIGVATREGLNHLAENLAARIGLTTRDIEQVVIAGNTAMVHLLMQWPSEQLGRAPYMPACTTAVQVKARELGLNFAPGAEVYVMPAVAGFVGGDHTAMILGSRIHQSSSITLGLDIGTNTEIVLANNGEMISCSCASGPAFEGANIHQGMRAMDGAVCRISVDSEGTVGYETVGQKPPLGLCGSGILDAVAELTEKSIINRHGILDRDHPRTLIDGPDQPPRFLIVPAESTGIDRDIVVTQKDISSVQLAKAAIASGIRLLLAASNLTMDQVDKVFVAGAFGTHLRLESAIAIGMLPDLPLDRFIQVGNAAGVGACMALASMTERRQAEHAARQISYLELASLPDFGRVFAQSLELKRINSL